jgi:hypothetical protein
MRGGEEDEEGMRRMRRMRRTRILMRGNRMFDGAALMVMMILILVVIMTILMMIMFHMFMLRIKRAILSGFGSRKLNQYVNCRYHHML